MLMERWQLTCTPSLKVTILILTIQLIMSMEVRLKIIIKTKTMIVKRHTLRLIMEKQTMRLITKSIPQHMRMLARTMKRLLPTMLHLIIIKKTTTRPSQVDIPLVLIRKRTTMLRPPTHTKQVKLLKML